MIIGIAIVCTNSYFVLGIRFVKKFMKHYKGTSEIKFYLFTDTDPIPYLPNITVRYINNIHKSWVDGANSKFKNLIKLRESKCDYLYYFDADTNITKDFTEKWFIGSVVGGEHFDNKTRMKDIKDYDRNPVSTAYIPFDTKLSQTYYLGAFFGGKKDNVIDICKILYYNQMKNLKIGHEPIWNDESYLNHYYHFNPPSLIIPFSKFEFVTSDKGDVSQPHDITANVESMKKELLNNNNKLFDIIKGKIIF
jgi:hypothetical protein